MRWALGRLRRAGDSGNISVLTLGCRIFAMMTLLVISAATAVHLERMRLVHLADELAEDAADALDLDEYYAGDAALPTDDAAIELAQGRMESAVQAHLDQRASGHLRDVIVRAVATPDGSTAVVTVSVVVHPLFSVEALLPFLDGIEITATGSARNF